MHLINCFVKVSVLYFFNKEKIRKYKKYDYYKNYSVNGVKVISGWNRFFMFVILGVNSRCMGFLFFLWVSILIRIFKKTSGSYIVKDTQYVVNNTSTTISDNREVSINYGTRQVNLK